MSKEIQIEEGPPPDPLRCPVHGGFVVDLYGGRHCNFTDCDWTVLPKERPCTRHPSEAPVPCQHKGAFSECAPAAFRDAVIAGLRERGWPEPSENSSLTCPMWQSVEYGPPVVECELQDAPDNILISFEASDRWVGEMTLGAGMAAPEIVEAIDRLRWVIGLPPLVAPIKKPEPARRGTRGRPVL
jgi:hypothetical protein